MWPHLLGTGWIWGALVAAGLAASGVAIAVRASSTWPAARRDGGAQDGLQTIWHRYEEGDLTRWEFERLVSSNQARVH